MTHFATTPSVGFLKSYAIRLGTIALATIALTLTLGAGSASAASKEAIAYFGTEANSGSLGGEFDAPSDVAVNSSGAGSADQGDIYVIDYGNRRIQRFAQNDNGTPTNQYDDGFVFISAWGADVNAASSGGSDYEICTVATECKAGIESGGNGTAAGNGVFGEPRGIAVDQDSGDVYVADRNRISVYAGDGTFLRSFGFDVVATGPSDIGTGFEVCVAAAGDVCKAGVSGAGVGQIGSGYGIAVSSADGNPASGTVFAADDQNHRINTYDLDGSSPSSFGAAADFSTGPRQVAVDSRGIVYARDTSTQIDRYDSQNANGGGVGFLAPIGVPPLLESPSNGVMGLEVDPDSDGGGTDSDVLYAMTVPHGTIADSVIQQFGPINPPGLSAPPTAVDDVHGSVARFNFIVGLGLDIANGRLFVSTQYNVGGPFNVGGIGSNHGVYVLDTAGGPPSASLDSVGGVTSTTATVHATVNPNGPPNVTYQLEYSTDGTNWEKTPRVLVGSQETPQSVTAVLNPPAGGLQPNTFYHVRLGAAKVFAPSVVTPELTFTTLAEAPVVETTGSLVRTATTAQLSGRVNPRNKAAIYHFEYGDQGPCDANVCTSTEPHAAGSGGVLQLVAEEIAGLQANRTYHYRLVADNGAGSPSIGSDMTITTRASDAPLSHGHFPGPPGSDRAFEQVSTPDSGGNPVSESTAFSGDGNRAVYSIAGGTPISETGTFQNFYFAQRSATGWQTKNITPRRSELVGSGWSVNKASSDLSRITIRNSDASGALNTLWQLFPEEEATRMFDAAPPHRLGIPGVASSIVVRVAENPHRLVVGLNGGELDPSYPTATAKENLYDVTSGSPQLVSLLPGNTVAACGIGGEPNVDVKLSVDGSLLFFPSRGSDCASPKRLYMRHLDSGTTSLVTPPALSGLECDALSALRLSKDAFFFWTLDRLTGDDANPTSCNGSNPPSGDIYRYDLESTDLKCVTCVVAGLDADVIAGQGGGQIAISQDGSRIYFRSESSVPLLPGAVAETNGTYRLDTETGKLRWLGQGIVVSPVDRLMTPDGAIVLFESSAAALNPLGGTSNNGGVRQAYRYDDRDGSMVCISCPQDGSAASSAVSSDLSGSAGGEIVAFSTPTALAPADQNTPAGGQSPARGTDVYEWREGRLFLITDGLTDWPNLGEPRARAVTPSGRDLYFTAAAQYTSDALDGYQRLYDARIGGGFDFPEAPTPCPLEVCQGTPKGAPEEVPPGTGAFAGPGNAPSTQRRANCPKGKHKVRQGKKTRCVRRQNKKAQRKANNDRRAQR